MHKKKLIIQITALILLAAMLTAPVAATEPADPPAGDIVDPYKLYTYEQMLTDLDALQARYPDLITLSSLGTTVQGRDIPMFTFGTGKREILLCATMHAREYVSTNFVMYMVEQYCKAYENYEYLWGLSYREMLDSVRFIVVPMLNPDGVAIAQGGIENAQNKEQLLQMEITDSIDSGYYGWKTNANGVDLNHNWPYFWDVDKKVKVPASANYNGTGPCTEPEVIAMKKLIDSSPLYMLGSFHTSGKVIYWIDTSNSYEMYNAHRPIIKQIANGIGYKMLGYEDVSRFGGFMVNYARGTYGFPAFTVELCPFYDTYPFSDYAGFASTVNSVYPIGMLMANAVVHMNPQPEAIDVRINDRLVLFNDIRPTITDDRTLVPLRAVCEAIGLNVEWNAEAKQITITDGSKTLMLEIGSTTMTAIDSDPTELDTPPCIVNDRTMIPIRAIAESFDCTVDWDAASRTVCIATPAAAGGTETSDATVAGDVTPDPAAGSTLTPDAAA